MLARSLAILSLMIAAVLAASFGLRGANPLVASGLLWGVGGGAVAALTAIGGAWWAESRRMRVNQALAIVVVGMLFRMMFLGGWLLLAIKLSEFSGLAFIIGFGLVFVTGQILEVWMLFRLGSRQPPADRPRRIGDAL